MLSVIGRLELEAPLINKSIGLLELLLIKSRYQLLIIFASLLESTANPVSLGVSLQGAHLDSDGALREFRV